MHALEPLWQTLKAEFTAACSQSAQAARCQIAHELNQVLRRLRQYRTEGEWAAALLDCASQSVDQAAVFALESGELRLLGARNLDLPANFSFPVTSAPAFAAAIESRDPVVAMRTSAEVTGTLGVPDEGERAHIIPIANGSRVAAVLFAAARGYVDVNALELVAGMASIVLERQANASLHSQIATFPQPANLEAPVAAEREKNGSSAAVPETKHIHRPPKWIDLTEEQRELHIRAQRFSQTTVSNIERSRAAACCAAREQANVYGLLKNEIDQARETYRREFMVIPWMVDYLHMELVRTAAEGDELKMGADYPGQLL